MSFDMAFDDAFDAPPQDKTTALLIRARGLIERGWCKGGSAVDANGTYVNSDSDLAVAWCAVGALNAAGMKTSLDLAAKRLRRAIGGGAISRFNDAQETVEPILAAFDRAIAATESGP